MVEKGNITITVTNGIARIKFYHPKSNSLPGTLLSALADNITRTASMEEAKVIVLESEGEGAFCGGASFDELIEIKDFETGKNFFMGFARVINAMRKCPKFIIARIHGKAVGGGVGLAAAADYTLAGKEAHIKLSELALGIGPFVVGPAVERKIGSSAFSAMSMDYDWRGAGWAKERGLYTEIYDSITELDEAVEMLASKLAAAHSSAMSELKKIFWEGCENWDELLEERAEISGRLILSDYSVDYISKFKGKK